MNRQLRWLACALALTPACADGRPTTPDTGVRRDAFAFDSARDAYSRDDAFTALLDVRVPPGDTASCSGSTTRCGAVCVDTMTDPAHCGACGMPCALPNATTLCGAGVCGVGACNSGFANCNGTPGDGCERAVSCTAGAACATSCGSMGTTNCTDACAPTCSPPAEVCNLVDDDCEGTCDDISGCHRGVHRSVDASGHFYTIDRTEASCCGFTPETYDYFFVMTAPAAGTQTLHRCLTGTGYHIYTTDPACEGAIGEGSLGYIATTATCGAIPLYRLRNRAGDNLYTTASAERTSAMRAGYTFVGITGYVWPR